MSRNFDLYVFIFDTPDDLADIRQMDAGVKEICRCFGILQAGSDAGQPSARVQALAWVGEQENTEFSFIETHLSPRFRLDTT